MHITRQMLSALKAAHARGIVHRDLKPENIFLIQRAGDPDFVKVLDFGIVKMLDEELGSELTQAGQVVGTPTYMAPEQARGAEIDQRVDVYATGAILYRMVTGHRPFQGPNFNSLLFAIAQGNPTAPRTHAPEVTAQLEAAILRAMAVDARARFSSASEFDEALSEEDRTDQKSPTTVAGASEAEPSKPEWSQRSGTLMGDAYRGPTRVRRAISGAMSLVIVIGLTVVLIGGTLLVVRRVLRLRAGAELAREAEAARARVLAAPRPQFVIVTLEVDPPSARLTIDGAQVSGARLELVRDGSRHVLKAEADGYVTEERAFLTAGDQKLTIKLRHGKTRRPARPLAGAAPVDDGDEAKMKTLQKLLDKLGDETQLP